MAVHILKKATRQHTKDHNSRLVFQTIYAASGVSRADLARLTGLTRATISDVVADLIRRGLVAEGGMGVSSGGRLPIQLYAVDDARCVLALTLADEVLTAALVNMRGVIRARQQVALNSTWPETVLEQMASLITQVLQSASSPVLGIGISLPGLIDSTNGVVRRAVNYGWTNVPVREYLMRHFPLPVYLGNEAQMAALSEYTFGADLRTANLAVISAGLGIGMGLIINGQLFSGDGWGAGEIGHVVVLEHGRQCNCGNYGCLETVASSSALLRTIRMVAADHPNSLVQPLVQTGQLTLETLQAACQAGDQVAQAAVVEAGRYLGIAVANLVGLLNIERVVITGAMAGFGSLLGNAISAAMHRHALPLLTETTLVELMLQPDDAQLMGATALLLQNELGLYRLLARTEVGSSAARSETLQAIPRSLPTTTSRAADRG